jgi:hypothetical protein
MPHNLPAVSIYELPSDDAFRQVTMLGAILPPTPQSAEHTCEVILTKLIDLRGQPGGFAIGDEPITVLVGVGALPAMQIGHIFKGQRLYARAPAHWRENEVVFLSDSPHPIRCYPFGQSVALPRNQTAPSVELYPVGTAQDSYLFHLRQKDHKSASAYLPAHELIRYFWGGTGAFYKRTFDGQLGIHAADSIFDPTKSGWIDEESGQYHITAARALTNGEIRSALWRCVDIEFARFHRQISQETANAHINSQIYIPRGCLPRFMDSAWRYNYVWIGVRDGDKEYRRQLITRILEIKYDLGVRKVTVDFPGATVLDEHSPTIEKVQTVKSYVSNNEPTVRSSVAPGAANRSYEFSFDDEESNEYEIERRPRLRSTGNQPIRKFAVSIDEPTIGSTAEVGSGDSNIFPVSIIDRRPIEEKQESSLQDGHAERPIASRLQLFLDTIEHINNDRRFNARCELLSSPDGRFWFYPIGRNGEENAWSYMNKKANIIRRVAILEVIGTHHFYLFESETKWPGSRVGILKIAFGNRPSNEFFEQLLSNAAQHKGVWDNISKDTYSIESQVHHQDWDSARLAEFIKRRLRIFGHHDADFDLPDGYRDESA